MRVLLATTDPIRLSFLMALLRDAGFAPIVLDGHVSAMEGGIGIFPRRLAVPEDEANRARRVLHEGGEADGLDPAGEADGLNPAGEADGHV